MAKTFIIAEAGVNHNGSLELAFKLVDAALEAGADAVKFQTFKADNLVTKIAKKAAYQSVTSTTEESQYDMIKKLELSPSDHAKLFSYCRQKEIAFLSSPFDIDSLKLLHDLGLEIIKVPSGEITNLPLLRELGRLRKRIIMSTGMADMEEVETAVKTLLEEGIPKEEIVLLHCNTEYPTPFEDVNLRAMLTMREEIGVKVGYSDHTRGIEVPIAAVALGAEVIEKHFTLSRNLIGPDHKASLEPNELKDMIISIRNIELAMGDGVKKPSPSEINNIRIVRKSIVAIRKIRKGEIFSEKNIGVKRPATGLSPIEWDNIIGKKASKDYILDELITKED